MVNFTKDFSIEKIGALDCDVFDIEVDEHHNFFANDILCHNSMYTTSSVPDMVRKKHGKDVNTDIMLDYLASFSDKKVQPCIQAGYEELAEYMNSNQKMFMKKEAVSDRGVFFAAKTYIIRIVENEGNVRLSKPKIKSKGVEIVRSTTPSVVKPVMQQIMAMLLDGVPYENIRLLCAEFKKQFFKMDVHEIGKPCTMNHTFKYSNLPNSTPIHIRGGVLFNKWIRERNIKNMQILDDGTKMKYIYLKQPNKFYNQHVISYSDNFPDEILKYVDYEKQFDTVFMTPIANKFDKLGVDIRSKRKKSKFLKTRKPMVDHES